MTQEAAHYPDCESEMQVIKLLGNSAPGFGQTEIGCAVADANVINGWGSTQKRGALWPKNVPFVRASVAIWLPQLAATAAFP